MLTGLLQWVYDHSNLKSLFIVLLDPFDVPLVKRIQHITYHAEMDERQPIKGILWIP